MSENGISLEQIKELANQKLNNGSIEQKAMPLRMPPSSLTQQETSQTQKKNNESNSSQKDKADNKNKDNISSK